VTEAERLKPDVIVLDIAMPLSNGLDAGREVKRFLPRTRLVYLTMSEDPDLAAEAFRIGASAFLLKSSAASELIVAIRAAMSGRSYVTPRVTQALVDACTAPGAAARGSEAAGRRLHDEAGGRDAECHGADRRVSQVPNDGAASDSIYGGTRPVCDEAASRVTSHLV
jgi:CheY-like chemotaxis protein